MDSESSDILGGPSLEIGPSGGNNGIFNGFVAVAICSLVWLAWYGRVRILKWRETSYKKSMRRRHGIPDEDERPFNVAYAAAVRAREREEGGSSAPGGPDKRSRNALAEGQQGLHQRFSDVVPQSGTSLPWQDVQARAPPQITQSYPPNRPFQNAVQTDHLDEKYKPIYPALYVTGPDNDATYPGPTPIVRQSSKLSNIPAHIRKRSFDEDEDDSEPTKKSRVEGEEFIDGDEDAAWAYARGAKRGSTDDDDEGYESTRGDKRPRKVSRDKTPEDQIMEDDEMDTDEITDLRSIPRGKKRDRAAAGSTFGGDDEEGEEQLDGGKASRRRKRKMLSKRKSDAPAQARGRKRDMEESDEENVPSSQSTRRKRGKKEDEEEGSDVSMNESLLSRGSYVKGRRIGEEWEVNGALYKVGVNGQRLRQALVKKARNKFPMPKDSQHPDREANLEVFVETWLTEEEYKDAKERHELAWQDTPKPSAEPETPGNVPDSPSIKGKNLLWASAAVQESPLPTRRPFRQSIATNMGLRINAFPETQTASGRRVSSAYSPLATNGAMDIPTRKSSAFRTFSKWEKQDLEAEAMAKMRAKLQEQKKPSVSDIKSIGLGAPPLVASVSAPGSTDVGSSAGLFPQPTNKASATPLGPSISLGMPNGIGSAGTSKPPIFSAPSNNENKSQPSLSFGKPSGPPSSVGASTLAFPAIAAAQPEPLKPTSTAPASSLSVPNFFAAKGVSSTPSLAMPTLSVPSSQPAAPASTFGVKAPANGSNSSPSLFSFGNPSSKPVAPFGAQPTPIKDEKPAQENGSGPSLLGRMGGFTAPASKDTATTTTPNGSPFSFGKTSTPSADPVKSSTPIFDSSTSSQPKSVPAFGSSQPTSVFGSSSAATKPVATSAFSTNSAHVADTALPKFSFGITKSSTPSGSTSAPEPPKATASAFGFSNPSVPKPASAEPAEATSAPKFKFSVPGGGSAFGSIGAQSATTAASTTTSAFNAFAGNGAGTNNPFSTTPAVSPNQATGNFAFGGNPTTPSTSATVAENPKPSFSFGGNSSTTTPAANGGSTFSFGAGSPFAPAAAPATSATQSVFGKPSAPTPSAFGFGTSSFKFGGKQ